MSVHAAPMALARPRRRRGCLGALGYAILGALACLVLGIVLTIPHADRVRQWHPYGAKGPAVTVYHRWTWGHALSLDSLLPFGYDRYEILAGQDPSGSYGEVVPIADLTPGSGELAKVRVTGDKTGITITYSTGDQAFIPKANLYGR